jgi:hypothetical protein
LTAQIRLDSGARSRVLSRKVLSNVWAPWSTIALYVTGSRIQLTVNGVSLGDVRNFRLRGRGLASLYGQNASVGAFSVS